MATNKRVAREAPSESAAGYTEVAYRTDSRANGPDEGSVESSEPMFSLTVQDGAGALMGLAQGEGVGSVYGALAQQAVVLAYHLLDGGSLRRADLAKELVALAGDGKRRNAFRDTSADLQTWIGSEQMGEPVAVGHLSAEPAARVAPIGLWFRRDPDAMIRASLESSRLTHSDGPSAIAAAAAAAGVAAAAFAQLEQDFLLAIVETTERAIASIDDHDVRFGGSDLDALLERIRSGKSALGSSPTSVFGATGPDPLGVVAGALVVGASSSHPEESLLSEVVAVGGRSAGAIVGAVVGARAGTGAWSQEVPNGRWLMEVGRRLAAGKRGVADLPIPWAVEERLTYSGE